MDIHWFDVQYWWQYVQHGGLDLGTLFTLWILLLQSLGTPLTMLSLNSLSLGSLYLTMTTTSTPITIGFTLGKTTVFYLVTNTNSNSSKHFDALNCNFLLNHITNRRFKILSSLFKLFILMVLSIIKRWSRDLYLSTTSSLFDLLSLYSFS